MYSRECTDSILGASDFKRLSCRFFHLIPIARLQKQVKQPMYQQAIDALRLRFDPPGRKELFKADLRTIKASKRKLGRLQRLDRASSG